MRNFIELSLLIITIVFSTCMVNAKDFSFEDTIVQMNKCFSAKKYDKALKLGLKAKRENLTESQKKTLQKTMEELISAKQFDDAVKTFSVSYDKYEDYYVYSPKVTFSLAMHPYIYVRDNVPLYKIRFCTYHYSRKSMKPDKVFLYADGKNMVFDVFTGDDVLVNYNTYQRKVTAHVNLTPKQLGLINQAMNANDVSFKIKDTNSSISAENKVFNNNKEFIKNGYVLNFAIINKLLKPGENRI